MNKLTIEIEYTEDCWEGIRQALAVFMAATAGRRVSATVNSPELQAALAAGIKKAQGQE